MRFIKVGAVAAAALFVAGLIAAFVMVASPLPPIAQPRDVFDFAALRGAPAVADLPGLRRYPARDGEELAYRFYDSDADRILIFVHGSSYHGAGYHALAAFLSSTGIAKVALPNLRGHYQSGRRRGDVDYIGQLEDDLADMIGELRRQSLNGPVTLGGHSSGGGLAIRFAGGAHRALVSGFVLLAPIVPVSPSVKGGDAGGWASLHRRRLYGLLALNAIGIRGFNALPIVEFNKPARYWDGTETLSYSYRLNTSYHPRYRYQGDLAALGDKTLVLIGENDQAIDAQALRAMFAADAPRAEVAVLPQVSHFGIFNDKAALDKIAAWLRAQP